jgi:hypothetical protein
MVGGLGSLTSSPPLFSKMRPKVSMPSLGGGWAVAEEEGAMSAVAEEEGTMSAVAEEVAERLLEEAGRLPEEVVMERESRLPREQQQQTKLQEQS